MRLSPVALVVQTAHLAQLGLRSGSGRAQLGLSSGSARAQLAARSQSVDFAKSQRPSATITLHDTTLNSMTPRFLATCTALVLATSGAGITACSSSDSLDKAEFITQVGKAGIEKPVAECAFTEIEKDSDLVDKMVSAGGYTNKISVSDSKKLSKIMAKCLIDVDQKK